MDKATRRCLIVYLARQLGWDPTCRHDLQVESIVGVNAIMAFPKDDGTGCLILWKSGNVWVLPTLSPRATSKYLRSLLKGQTPCTTDHPPLKKCRWVHEGIDALGWRR